MYMYKLFTKKEKELKIRKKKTFRDKENYEYLRILKCNSIKQAVMKDKILKNYLGTGKPTRNQGI